MVACCPGLAPRALLIWSGNLPNSNIGSLLPNVILEVEEKHFCSITVFLFLMSDESQFSLLQNGPQGIASLTEWGNEPVLGLSMHSSLFNPADAASHAPQITCSCSQDSQFLSINPQCSCPAISPRGS